MSNTIEERLSRLERIKSLENVKPENITKVHKMMLLENFLEQKEMHPNVKAAGIAKSIGSSLSTINRTRKDLGVKSFYQYDIPVNKVTRLKEVDRKQESFKCSDCNKDFKSKPAMASHKRIHSKKSIRKAPAEIKSAGRMENEDELEQSVKHRPEHVTLDEARATLLKRNAKGETEDEEISRIIEEARISKRTKIPEEE